MRDDCVDDRCRLDLRLLALLVCFAQGPRNEAVFGTCDGRFDIFAELFFDFGKDLFPTLCGKMFAFKSDGYWSDVGTLTSLYMANKFADSGVWY